MPRSAHAHREATYQDVLDAPEEMIAEILDGELVLSPRPAAAHANSASDLGADLRIQFGRRGGGGPGGWQILYEPELHLGRHVLVPDLAGWRRERMPVVSRVAFFEQVPDWVCEVLSPGTAVRDRMRKMRIYARHGVPHTWLVDPEARMLETYRLSDGHWLQLEVFAGDTRVRAEPFDAVELDMTGWWLPEPEQPEVPPPADEG
ncbi:MAG: Uma2 family endonuclease [Deltaproteobacteria bacterium]|nr:Uma2 family endonuclease [Deltaproteobacteria bacterium]